MTRDIRGLQETNDWYSPSSKVPPYYMQSTKGNRLRKTSSRYMRCTERS